MVYDWTKMNVIPIDGVEAWHQYVAADSANGLCKDYSGKGRDIAVASNTPVLTSNVLNGQSGWYFNGTKSPLAWTGGVNLKHVFVVCSVDEAVFGDYRGLVSGLTTGDILTGGSGTSNFFDYSPTAYYRANVSYVSSAALAPVSGAFAVVEIIYNAGVSLDGIQIGKHKNLTARLWKGYFLEHLAYSTVKNDFQRLMIYRYFAMRYHLWTKTAAGLDVFPFPADKTQSSDRDQEQYSSTPYSGDPDVLVRGQAKRNFTAQYSLRIQPEFEAAESYCTTHRAPVHSIYRDNRFNPSRDSEGWIATPLREQGSDTSFRFNYTFGFSELG